jgi:hypothetical protein
VAASIADARAVLAHTPAAFDALLAALPAPMLAADDGPETWSPLAVLRHVVWCEAQGWVSRLRTIRERGGADAVQPLDRDDGFRRYADWSPNRLLGEFARLRSLSLAELDELALTPADLALEGRHPGLGAVTLGQLLATWVTHDLAHLAQISRVLARHTGRDAGPFRVNFSLLRE